MHQSQHTPPSYQNPEDHALNVAIAQSVVDQAAWEAARGSGSAQQGGQLAGKRSAGEGLSLKLWQEGSLGFNDVITDGFYDLYGDFPEVSEGPNDFPTLENLRKVRTGAGDVREVVLLDHERDHGLLEVEEALSEAMAEAKTQDVAARIQVVANVVADRFGGAYDSEASLEHFWQVSSATEKRRTRSAVVLLCRLEVGAMRHRALLFKVLADAVKLPCRLIRGQALCGADSAANAVVLVGGQEAVVDLVFEPGRLYLREQFAALVELRRTRLDNWRGPAPLTNAGSFAEVSGVSVSSASSAGTLTGAGGSLTAIPSTSAGAYPAVGPAGAADAAGQPQAAAAGAPSIPQHVSTRSTATKPLVAVPPVPAPGAQSSSFPGGGVMLGHGGGPGSGGWLLGGPAGQHVHGNPPAIAGNRVRFTISDRPKGVVGSISSGGSAATPTAGGAGGSSSGGGATAAGIGIAPSSSSASSGVANNGLAVHVGRVEIRSVAAAPPPHAGAAITLPGPPALASAPPSNAGSVHSSGSGFSGGGRQSSGSLPGKAKSMVDLNLSHLSGRGGNGPGGASAGGHHPSASASGGDLIRLDSEPLPEAASFHLSLPDGPGMGLPPPERSNTPTGHGPSVSPRGPAPYQNRRQNSFDQNGWVKFSGSFTRNKDDTRPPSAHAAAGGGGAAGATGGAGAAAASAFGPGPSPLGQAAADRAGHQQPPSRAQQQQGPPPRQQPQASVQPPMQQQQQQSQRQASLELVSSFTSICTTPSPDGPGIRSSAGSGTVNNSPLQLPSSAEIPGSGAAAAGGQPAAAGPGAQGPGVSAATASSPFAHFQLPADFPVPVPSGGSAANGAAGSAVSGAAASAAASSTGSASASGPGAVGPGGSSVNVNGVKSRPASQSQLPQAPRQEGQGAAAAAGSLASPFQAMQVGAFGASMQAGGMPSLAAAFPTQPTVGPAQAQPPSRSSTAGPTTLPGQVAAPGPSSQGNPQNQGTGLQGGMQEAIQSGAPGTVPLPRMGSLTYAGQPTPQHAQHTQQQQQPRPPHGHHHQHPTRQLTGGSHDPMVGSRSFGHHSNGMGAVGGPMCTPPAKAMSMLGEATGAGAGGLGTGSKAPSPALSTPFTHLTASSVHSATPPGSAPAEGASFANLSPFNYGEGAGGASSSRDPAQYFADLSPFNTGGGTTGTTSSGGSAGAGDGREITPGRRRMGLGSHSHLASFQQQPIVELPSSDNSRDATPRVSYTNIGSEVLPHHQQPGGPSGPSSSGGGAGPPVALAAAGGAGAEYVTLNMARMRLGGGPAGNGRSSDLGMAGHIQHQQQQQQQQQMQMQQAFGAMAMAAAAAAQQQHPQQQQQMQQLAMAYYAAAMQNPAHPHSMYYQQQAVAAAAAAAGMAQAQGYMPHGHQGGGWAPRGPFEPPWPQTWAPHQQQQHHQQQQYMFQSSLLQQQQQQQQAAQQQGFAAARLTGQGLAGVGGAGGAGPMGLPVLEHRTSFMSTTTTTVVNTAIVEAAGQGGGMGTAALGPGPGMLRQPQSQPQLPSTGPQLALPPAPYPTQQQQDQHSMQAPVDLAHEMTVPSAQRLAALAAVGAAGGERPGGSISDGGSGGQDSSPLALQPSVSVSAPLPPSYKDLEIEPVELTFGPRIGIGSYGEVYKGTWRGTEVAIKRFLEQNLSPITIREFRDEVMIMSKLRHPNIVLFMGAVTRSNQLAIVTQFVQRGSLFRLLHRTKVELDPRRRLSMAQDIAKGMEYLHNCKPVLVHRDLKSPNLLVDRDWTIKVCDFGLSQVKMNTFLTAKSQGGSPAWMAPEILRGEPCDEKSDVFSFGVILYELVTGKEPWEDLNPMQVVGAVGFSGKRMDLPPDLDPAVTAMIRSCWANSPRDRPSFSQILATMNGWSALRPTAAVMQQMEASARARHQRAAA